MTPTPEQSAQARAILARELVNLQAKAEGGQTLRAGERKFLLAMLEPVDDEWQQVLGARIACVELEARLCKRCKGAHLPAYRRELETHARELGQA